MNATARITTVNIYRYGTDWCYRADDANGFNHADVIDLDDGATEDDARAEIAKHFPGAEIKRVADLTS